MKKQYNESSIYDFHLKQLDKDKDVIWNKNRKQQVKLKIIDSMDQLEQRNKWKAGWNAVLGFGVLIVFLLVGYQFMSSNNLYTSEETTTNPQGQDTEEGIIMSDPAEEKTKEKEIENEGAEFGEIDLRLPAYVPDKVDNPEPQYVVREYRGGTGPVEVKYYESESHYFSFSQSELFVNNKEDTIQHVKNTMYQNDVLDEMEIGGHPAFLRLEGNDGPYYSSLHIITDSYFFTVTTHGIEKEEMIKIAESIDFTGL
jgi:hypothetical protein